MKKSSLFILFLFFFFNSFAQGWFENNPEWYWGNTISFGEPVHLTVKTFVAGDTIIDNQNYKVLKSIFQRINISTIDTTYFEGLHGYFYEEDQKVYKRTFEGDDQVLFDTNLEIGDSLFYERPCGGVYLVYYASNFQNIYGEEIEVQFFDVQGSGVSYDFPVFVYPGIGIISLADDMYGTYDGFNPEPIFECAFFDPPNRFYCYKNDFVEYSKDGPCKLPGEITTNLSFEESGREIEIYPNPFIHEIRLKSLGVDGELSARITQIDGTMVKEFQNISSNRLDVTGLKEGMYFLTFYSKGKFLGIEKIIKWDY